MIHKFRGKSIERNNWVTGDIHFGHGNKTAHIHTTKGSNFSIKVHPESVGLCTGVEDENGKLIFGSIEIDGKMTKGGDVVKVNDAFVDVVEFNYGAFIFEGREKSTQGTAIRQWSTLEILGNATDDHELLQGKKPVTDEKGGV